MSFENLEEWCEESSGDYREVGSHRKCEFRLGMERVMVEYNGNRDKWILDSRDANIYADEVNFTEEKHMMFEDAERGFPAEPEMKFDKQKGDFAVWIHDSFVEVDGPL